MMTKGSQGESCKGRVEGRNRTGNGEEYRDHHLHPPPHRRRRHHHQEHGVFSWWIVKAQEMRKVLDGEGERVGARMSRNRMIIINNIMPLILSLSPVPLLHFFAGVTDTSWRYTLFSINFPVKLCYLITHVNAVVVPNRYYVCRYVHIGKLYFGPKSLLFSLGNGGGIENDTMVFLVASLLFRHHPHHLLHRLYKLSYFSL